MILKKKFSNFLNSGIRKKFYTIEKIIGFRIYPTYFCEKGIKSLYSKIILNFLLIGKSKNFKKFFYQEIISHSNQKKNILISLPRSGSMATRLMLNSYFELLFAVGDGVPQYDNTNHKWNFIIPTIFSADLYNNLNLKNLSFNYSKYLNKENYNSHKIFFTRFPLSRIDVCKLENSKPVLIIREPNDQILSYYCNYKMRYILSYSYNYKDNKSDSINLINKSYENYINFTDYWYNYFKNKKHKNDFLIIKFKDIKENPKEVLTDVLNFYGIKLIESYVDISASTHTKENTSDRLKNIKLRKNRFTDIDKKKNFKEEVNLKLNILNKEKLLEANYNKIIGLKI